MDRPEFTSSTSRLEKIAFCAYLPVHLLLLPMILDPMVDAEKVSASRANLILYGIGMLFMLVIGFRFLMREYNALCDNFLFAVKTVFGSYLLMLAANYGVNEIVLSLEDILSGTEIDPLCLVPALFLFCVPALYDTYRKKLDSYPEHSRERLFTRTAAIILLLVSIIFTVQDIYRRSVAAALENPNNSAIIDLAGSDYNVVAAMAIYMAPFVEEPIFRAGFFGTLRNKNRFAAYAFSILAFSVYHVYSYGLEDPKNWIYIIQYIPVSYLLCRAYERTNSLWTSIFLHMLVNGVSVSIISAL